MVSLLSRLVVALVAIVALIVISALTGADLAVCAIVAGFLLAVDTSYRLFVYELLIEKIKSNVQNIDIKIIEENEDGTDNEK
jgi:energy-converting hydrogenase Eha subunit G